MSRIPKYTRNKAHEFYTEMCRLNLMYHPDDAPEDIVSGADSDVPLFTKEECDELHVINELIWADTNGDPCEVAYQVAVDRGEILEN